MFHFNHIALSVKDVDQSVEFYQKVFEFEEIQNTASNSKTRWLSIGEGRQLHLIPRPDFEIRVNKAVHVAFSTPEYDSFVRRLVELDLPYSDWLDTPSRGYIRQDGIKQVYFQDPNGYWLEINEDCP